MATSRTKTAAIGSAQWVQSEREHADGLIEGEVEEFGYSVRNELEWLNEHMADIFSSGHMNLTDVFKTPGKLRGKTPRTARKRDVLAPRQPLTDVFAPEGQSARVSPQKNAFFDKVAHFQIAEDAENQAPPPVAKLGNTDSGYHGTTEDEMDIDARTETATAMTSSQQSLHAQTVPIHDDVARPRVNRQDTTEGGLGSDESFLSAREDQISRAASKEQLRNDPESAGDGEIVDEMETDEPGNEETDAVAFAASEPEPESMDQDMEAAETLHSDASSPEKPLQRKSSFTFSALPAREPITAKRSIGARNSQMDAGRNSVLARSIGGKSLGIADGAQGEIEQEKQEETKLQNKSSTQLLHERISMLGKTKEPRTSKSIPQSALAAHALYPQLPQEEDETTTTAAREHHADDEAPLEDDEDDWIAPSKPIPQAEKSSNTSQSQQSRPGMHQKSISTTNIPSPTRAAIATNHQKAQSVSNPSLTNAAGTIESTTPAGSPTRKKHHDGPLSASKSKLWSALKSARNIFASSASASAAAKLEAHSNSPSVQRSPKRDFSGESKIAAVYEMPGAMYSEAQLVPSPTKAMSVKSMASSRKTRSSNESQKKREKEQKAQQKAADELEKAREKERQKAEKQQAERRLAEEAEAAAKEKQRQEAEVAAAAAMTERPTSAESDMDKELPPAPSKSMLPAGKLRAPGRLMRPTRAEPASRPAPVSIRVASQSQRLGQAPGTQTLSKSQHESMAPPPPPKTGLRTASAQGGVRSSTAPNNARVKALEAAARKKEADEKAAQKKAEQKREMERKRAAKVEEERRVEEERKAAEQARMQEAKLVAQRKAEQQAIEAKRREQQRLDQQRQQEETQRARAAHELAEAIKRERAQQAPQHPRGDVGGTLRQLAKNTVPDQSARPAAQASAAKAGKRLFQAEEDEASYAAQPQRPGMQRALPSYQQNDAKRRRTNEEQDQHEERHSVMAPPKRPSNMRKESTLSKFPHGYTHAPPPAAHHAANMFKATVTAQHQMQHTSKAMPSHPSQTVQMSTARIPFAENANPPAAHHPTYHQQQQTHAGHENLQPGTAINNKFKTPGRPAHAPNIKSAKSSPLYPQGDNIALPEIQTDSEDEDSEDDDATGGGFRAPSWVASPALRELLTQQQLADPETVFGPIGELKMDEMFKNGKNADRLKRFRDRGSSAAWIETGDAVTSAEKRRDMEMREQVVREGGWRYEPGV